MPKLILVSLPIGNLGDFSPRARMILQSAELIAAEDTRNFKSLCQKLEIDYSQKKIISWHDHAGEGKANQLMEYLEHQDVVLVSDAGSPLISDPAFPLIERAVEKGIEVDTIPGANAVIAALELSALPTTPFSFHAFLPRDKSKIKSFFDSALEQGGTHLVFESPNRILQSVEILMNRDKEVKCAVLRELTKKFQTVYRFTQKEWPMIQNQIVCKGEFVLAFYGEADKSIGRTFAKAEKLAQHVLASKGRSKELSKLLSELLDRPAKDLYKELSE